MNKHACYRFGQSVRRLREEVGYSQEKLAERANLSRSYIGEVERGEVVPSLLTLGKIAEALELRLSELIVHSEG